jgi:hypothetical protein
LLLDALFSHAFLPSFISRVQVGAART